MTTTASQTPDLPRQQMTTRDVGLVLLIVAAAMVFAATWAVPLWRWLASFF